MKTTILSGATGLALMALPVEAHELQHHSHVETATNVITVACFRGP